MDFFGAQDIILDKKSSLNVFFDKIVFANFKISTNYK